ncbi:MAG: glycerophosphodiester phosphodiesterase [Flavobacteriales bacterium]|nr:glycerophosphodiester phosphodiesterase [Flavobacteriales bacterium]NNK79875.1 glycerophosphodiester phosphodiesterase [Flavobacteriales bacterium]
MLKKVEWHGHRGCRGLLPENSLPAFLKAIDLGMDCLEMDVVISKDEKVVIAHEPYMPANICAHPDGRAVGLEEEKSFNLFEMNYDSIAQWNCGLKHPGFPEQQSQRVHRPLLTELFEKAESYSKSMGSSDVCYTIELKSHENFDGLYHPGPERFSELVINDISEYNLHDRCVIQSFDFRILRAVRKAAPSIRISMLLTDAFSLVDSISDLGFTPEIIGPRYQLVDEDLIKECQAKGIRVVPWTVNEVEDMRRLINLGVDGIITDYPDRKALIVD